MENKKVAFELKLKGKTCVFIDWANVFGWTKKNKNISIEKIVDYLKNYSEIKEIRLYFGNDLTNKKSDLFLKKVKNLGCKVVTKTVKFLKIYDDEGKNFILKRKCDFDLEVGLDALTLSKDYESCIFFSGDGDFRTLYDRLFLKKKQIIVVYEPGFLGKEIWEMKQGIFKIEVKRLLKKCPPVLTGGVIRDIIANYD